MRILIKSLEQRAKSRPEGYLQDVLNKGSVDGEYLVITPADYQSLIVKYNPQAVKGLGDVVAKVAQPIARAIDRVAGTNVAGCGGCKKRQEILNKVMPFDKL